MKFAWLSRWLVVAAGVLMVSLSPALSASNLAAHWEGNYYYGDARRAVPFTLDIKSIGPTKFKGRISEPATFGDGSALMLHADVNGTIHGNEIFFVKAYDGTGGQTQSVTYRGTLSSDRRHMSGDWSLGNDTGAFTADVQ